MPKRLLCIAVLAIPGWVWVANCLHSLSLAPSDIANYSDNHSLVMWSGTIVAVGET